MPPTAASGSTPERVVIHVWLRLEGSLGLPRSLGEFGGAGRSETVCCRGARVGWRRACGAPRPRAPPQHGWALVRRCAWPPDVEGLAEDCSCTVLVGLAAPWHALPGWRAWCWGHVWQGWHTAVLGLVRKCRPPRLPQRVPGAKQCWSAYFLFTLEPFSTRAAQKYAHFLPSACTECTDGGHWRWRAGPLRHLPHPWGRLVMLLSTSVAPQSLVLPAGSTTAWLAPSARAFELLSESSTKWA